jgi:hypothetical protein
MLHSLNIVHLDLKVSWERVELDWWMSLEGGAGVVMEKGVGLREWG